MYARGGRGGKLPACMRAYFVHLHECLYSDVFGYLTNNTRKNPVAIAMNFVDSCSKCFGKSYMDVTYAVNKAVQYRTYLFGTF